jgi:hypothetical protein
MRLIDMKKAAVIENLVSWAVSGAFLLAGFIAHSRNSGESFSILRYFGLMGCFCISLLVSAGSLKLWPSVLLVIFAAPPLLGLVSFLTAPPVGYGGQILAFALKCIFSAVVLSIAVLFIRHKLVTPWHVLRRRLVTAQILLVIIIFFFSGSFKALLPVQHEGRRIAVKELSFGRKEVSFPLIEKEQMFLVDSEGYLYKFEFATGKKTVMSRLPMPDPEEAGFTPDKGFPNVSSPPGQKSPRPWFSSIRREGKNMLIVEYPYHIGEYEEHPGGYSYSASLGLWHLQSVVDLETGTVTSWKVQEGAGGFEPEYPHPISVGEYEVIYGRFRESIDITGPDTSTRFWPKGRVLWFAAAGGNVLAGTDKGRVYIITLPVEGKDSKLK